MYSPAVCPWKLELLVLTARTALLLPPGWGRTAALKGPQLLSCPAAQELMKEVIMALLQRGMSTSASVDQSPIPICSVTLIAVSIGHAWANKVKGAKSHQTLGHDFSSYVAN